MREKIPYPLSPTHINVKNLFALKYKLKKEIGMEFTLQMRNIPLEGDDSSNIAKLLSSLLNS